MAEFRPPRRLNVYAFDPSTARNFDNRASRTVKITLPFELDPVPLDQPFLGPKGGYVEVVDFDPASGAFYAPIDLNADKVLHNDGLRPAPHDPKFHQQMVYAVTMNTIGVFEEALGRVVQWAPTVTPPDAKAGTGWQTSFTKRLRIYPHALREANAFYNPDKKALLFGYFTAPPGSGSAPAGTTVFTCLSHDIIVHETVHAILDGMHPSFAEDANPDMRGLHEAFADIIALFQLFSFPNVLEDQIAKTRGDLDRQSLLGELAQEFGQAVGRGCALRDFLGHEVNGVWQPMDPDPDMLRAATGPHARGKVLVAAVFRAYLTIYRHRVKDLFRIASGGSGVLRDGEIDPDLKRRLAAEAAQCARRVMRICIRAMDYTPPVNVSFGDYLRAIITADHDLFPEDTQGYRAAFIEAFASWGILPAGMPVISEPMLRWPTIQEAEQDRQALRGLPTDTDWLDVLQGNLGLMLKEPGAMLEALASPLEHEKSNAYLSRDNYAAEVSAAKREALKVADLIHDKLIEFNSLTNKPLEIQPPNFDLNAPHAVSINLLEVDDGRDREICFHASEHYQRLLWLLLTSKASNRFAQLVGLSFDADAPATVRRSRVTNLPSLHVASVRIAKRIGQRGQLEREYVVEVIQTRRGYLDPGKQAQEDARAPCFEDSDRGCDFKFRAGVTFLIDARSFAIRRLIRSGHRVDDDAGLAQCRAHILNADAQAATAFYSGQTGRAAAFTDLHRPGQTKDGFP